MPVSKEASSRGKKAGQPARQGFPDARVAAAQFLKDRIGDGPRQDQPHHCVRHLAQRQGERHPRQQKFGYRGQHGCRQRQSEADPRHLPHGLP